MTMYSLPSGTVPGLSHSQPVPRLVGCHHNQARDSLNNLMTFDTFVTFDTMVFERRTWCLTVCRASTTRAGSAHALDEWKSVVQISHGLGKKAVPKGHKATLRQQDCCPSAQTKETQGK